MAIKMCATIQLEERQANVEDELAGVKQRMEKMVIESMAARKTKEIMDQRKAQVIFTNVRLFVRA